MSTKRDYLLQIEKSIQCDWQNAKSFQVDVEDVTNPGEKYFATFPFPYCNGLLHVGHAFTLLKADFACRFQRMVGKNVLFPFGFHTTGMPIQACANKLKNEYELYPPCCESLRPTFPDQQHKPLNKSEVTAKAKKSSKCNAKQSILKYQWDILLEMGIDEVDIHKFQDPYYWMHYFSNETLTDLKALGVSCDFRRSFITTDMNRTFDLFVKWQFNCLKAQNKLFKSTKMSIMSPSSSEIISDHERSVGEGVKPQIFGINPIKCSISGETVFLIIATQLSSDSFTIYVDETQLFVLYIYHKNCCLCSKELWKNLSKQQNVNHLLDLTGTDALSLLKNCNNDKFDFASSHRQNSIWGFSLKHKTNKRHVVASTDFLYLPSALVVSRNNEICIVGPVDQWIIDYGESKWKQQVGTSLQNLETYNKKTSLLLKQSLDWLGNWGISRNFGLGSTLQFDDKYKVESLSDSTMYMCYYTISHIIQSQLFTTVSNEQLMQIYDCVFLNKSVSELPVNIQIQVQKCQKEFKYWYPIDLRVTGKDLIKNHLIMMLYNHAAILPQELQPKSVFVNGHLTINKQKMSKSSGNFLTLRKAIHQYSADAVRLTLADCGDSLNDGNFDTIQANSAILKLTKEENWIMSNVQLSADQQMCQNNLSATDENAIAKIANALTKTKEAYDKLQYREVLKYGFYNLLNIKNQYVLTKSSHQHVIYKFATAILISLHPICPHITQHIWQKIHAQNQNSKTLSLSWPDF